MRASAFFPPGLHPVLDGGERNEDPMVSPQMPTRGLIGQAVLDHQADGQGNDTVGVVGPRQGQVRHLSVEVLVAFGAMVNRIGEVDVMRTVCDQVSHIVQHPPCATVSIRTVPAVWAWLPSKISATLNDLWFRQVLDASDAFCGIGQVFAWSWHGRALLGTRFQTRNLTELPL